MSGRRGNQALDVKVTNVKDAEELPGTKTGIGNMGSARLETDVTGS